MTDLPTTLNREDGYSAILQYPEIVPELVDMIEPGDFYNPKHRIIFQGVCDLVSRKEPVDLATIADTVDVQFPAVGSYLSEIADKAPTSQVQNHVRLVLEHSALRQAISLCQKSMSELYGCAGNASMS